MRPPHPQSFFASPLQLSEIAKALGRIESTISCDVPQGSSLPKQVSLEMFPEKAEW